MMIELVLFLLLVILILLWKITYASPRTQGTFPSREHVSARLQSKTHRKTNVKARSILETTLKRNISPGYKCSPSASTSVIAGSVDTDEDSEGNFDSNGEGNATDTRDLPFGSEWVDAENEGNTNSNDEHDDTNNENGNHLYDEQQIFEAYVDRSILNKYIKKSGRLCGLMDYISEKKETWKEKKLNIAIIGNSGTGKSSLINAILGLRPSDQGAAEVGIIEITTKMKPYTFPGKDNLVLWDLPGVGTQAFQKEGYLTKCDISDFQVLVIVSATRFTENDIWLAREILQKGKYVFFVRTKIDIDLDSEKHDHPHLFDVSSCLQMVKKEINQNLKRANIFSPQAKVYVVSSRQKTLYDFPEMLEKLKNILNMKWVCVLNNLERYTKAATLQKLLLGDDVFGVQYFCNVFLFHWYETKTYSDINEFEKRFCIDDKSLDRVCRETGITVENLKTNHLNYFKEENIKMRRIKRMYRRVSILIPHLKYLKLCNIGTEDECVLINLLIKSLEKELLPM